MTQDDGRDLADQRASVSRAAGGATLSAGNSAAAALDLVAYLVQGRLRITFCTTSEPSAPLS